MDPTTHPDWPRAARAHAACAAGRCRYPSPDQPARPSSWPAVHDNEPICDGYAGTVHFEDGQLVIRWGLCARQRAWWQAEQHRIRHSRQRERRSHDAARRRLRDDDG